MVIWLVTVRAAEGRSPEVREVLERRMLPLLHARPGCDLAALAACINCAGEHTYLAYWADRGAVEAFEAEPTYRAVLDDLAPLLRVPPRRELWAILAR